MPDSDAIFLMIDQVLKDPLWVACAAFGALLWIVFVIYLFREMLQNVRTRYWR